MTSGRWYENYFANPNGGIDYITWGCHDIGSPSPLLDICVGNPLVTSGVPSLKSMNAELWCFLYVIACTKFGRDHCIRTTRMPAFWGYPPAASLLLILLSHIGSQVKRRQSQSYRFKEFAKTSTAEDTEQTRFCPHTDGQKDGQTDKVKAIYPPLSTSLKQGV